LGDGVGHVGGQLPVARAVADLQQVGVRRPRHLQVLQPQRDGEPSSAAPAVLGEGVLALLSLNWSTTGRSTESDSHQLDLRGQELVGVVEHRLDGLLADDARRRGAVDVHRRGRFVDRRQAEETISVASVGRHEAEDLPEVAAEDPQVVRQGHGRLGGAHVPPGRRGRVARLADGGHIRRRFGWDR
jgi:hypothetical protein